MTNRIMDTLGIFILIGCLGLSAAHEMNLRDLQQNLAANGSVVVAPINSSDTYSVSINLSQSTVNNCPSLENAASLTQMELLTRLTADCRYDKMVPPTVYNAEGEEVPMDIYARFYIYVMKDLDSSDLQFLVQGLLQLRYTDPRLAFSSYLPNRRQPIMGEAGIKKMLWVPHIFLTNEESSSVLGTTAKDELTTIYPNGTVLISTRLQANLYCWMNYQKFPFDEQKCTTILESWMYNTSLVALHWETHNPVTFDQQLQLTEYNLIGSLYNESIRVSNNSYMSHGSLEGNYSIISFTVLLTREVGYYVIDYFLPSIMIVTISWVSFWLQADQTPARTTLGCTTLLSFITLSLSQENDLMKVSYVTMSEVWFLVCTIFIFGSLVEFAFVNTIWRRNNDLQLKKRTTKYIVKSTFVPNLKRHRRHGYRRTDSTMSTMSTTSMDKSCGPNNTVITIETPIIIGGSLSREDSAISLDEQDETSTSSSSESTKEKPAQTFATMTPKEVSLWIDRKMRFVFPLSFIVFNALFWTLVYCL
ncbi:LOW QUALITY PROTEIN: pH-sensitive chloride channel 2 [Drosophila eugracilis]|uniref:LOW QUALITY PROTEIN: pH-sensitive chloride channel 2 n=1 Tax=Drosophila eugracilis TaxID=29029 RepID=UPI0007E66234|nr:LOW QUALITY PROTEIN: pH-sensitive chloride channel 2 [Drosophila eugracilis]